MASAPRSESLAAAAALVSITAFGASFPALAELHRYPIIGGQVLRYTLAGVLLFAFSRRTLPGRGDLPRVIGMAATGLIGTNALILAAERSTDPGTVGIIVGCLPVVVALVAPLPSRRRVDYRIVLCAAVAVLGTVLVESAGGRATTAGIAYAVGALVSEVAFILLGAPMFRRHGALAASTWMCVIAVLVLLVGGVVIDGLRVFPLPTAHQTFAIAYLAIVASFVGLVCWGVGLAGLGPERFGLFTGAIPIVALFASALLGLATITAARVLGCLLVAAAIGAGVSLRPPATVVVEGEVGSYSARS